METKARIHKLLVDSPVGEDIEAMSFSIIDREAAGHGFTPEQWEVVRRMIHTTGDVAIAAHVRFSGDAVAAGVEALCSGKPIYVDANMSRSGLSVARLQGAFEGYSRDHVHCHVADADVAGEAAKLKLPRSVAAVRKAAPLLSSGGIAVFGNAPTGLLELSRMVIEENIRPALVIGVPVGFVNVVESKAELMGLDVPYIVLEGRRGGSPLAVAILHALCTVAERKKTEDEKVEGQIGGEAGGQTGAKEEKMNVEHRTSNIEHRMENNRQGTFDTVILLGHGSRVPGADGSMLQVADTLRKRGRYQQVVTCNMSRLGPHFEEVFEECVREGSRNVLLLPYFLNQGLHMKLDIPEKMQAAVKNHPEVRLVFGKNLGYDELLVDLVEKRIGESSGIDDVRKVALPDEETYPVPEGQCEFVPMLPDVAAKWKETHGSEAGHHH